MDGSQPEDCTVWVAFMVRGTAAWVPGAGIIQQDTAIAVVLPDLTASNVVASAVG